MKTPCRSKALSMATPLSGREGEMPNHEPGDGPGEPCFLTHEDDPAMVTPSAEPPVGPAWWEGRWPHGGIHSLADLERWVNERLEEAIAMRWYSADTLGGIALSIGRQAVENATRYLARFGSGNHPPRVEADRIRDFAGVQNALEALLRHIKQEQMTTAGASNVSPARQSLAAIPAASGGLDGYETADSVEEAPDPETFVIDRGTFTVRWRGKTCRLDNTKPFRLLVRFARRPGLYVPMNLLFVSVWPEQDPERNTVQKTASNLRKKLKDAGMGDLIGSQHDHYALELPDGTLARITPGGASEP